MVQLGNKVNQIKSETSQVQQQLVSYNKITSVASQKVDEKLKNLERSILNSGNPRNDLELQQMQQDLAQVKENLISIRQKNQILENNLNKKIQQTNKKLSDLYADADFSREQLSPVPRVTPSRTNGQNFDFNIRLRRVGRNFTRIAENIERIEEKIKRQEVKIDQIQAKTILSPAINQLVSEVENLKRNLEFVVDDIKRKHINFII